MFGPIDIVTLTMTDISFGSSALRICEQYSIVLKPDPV